MVDAEHELRRMARAIAHRGPDDERVWSDRDAGIGLCHRRLSIIELSPLGSQPMHSASGRFVMVFNGEIYNYRELRLGLEGAGCSFRGSSDTEVLLAAFERFGVDETLRRSRGMFAIALWDKRDRTLYLARDRFGEKPLYYGRVGETFLFGSELKALRAHSEWCADVNRDALTLLLRHYYISGPQSIYRGISRVSPGSILQVRFSDTLSIEERSYWTPSAVRESSGRRAREVDDREAIDRVEQALTDAVRLQMVADVPVGAFLSGGVDSSLIVSLMQKASSRAVRTFTIGFTDEVYDEAPFARKIARHIGTEHVELIVTPADALDVIPRLPEIYDEPFADSSQIPTYLVSKLARQNVTVSLSGDGGDELFGGYSHYQAAFDYWQRVRRIPTPVRALARSIMARMPLSWMQVLVWPAHLAGGHRPLADRIKESSAYIFAPTFPSLYREFISLWHWPEDVVIGSSEPDTACSRSADWPANADPFAHMMYMDTRQYLPDDILVKVDRAAMAVSLETRVPLLDHEVAAAAWGTPLATHRRDGVGKWVLRELLARHVPRELFERPKRGFAVPVARWLREELRDWADDLLEPALLRRQGILNADLVTRRWQQHRDNVRDWSAHLWCVLMFQAWFDRWERGP